LTWAKHGVECIHRRPMAATVLFKSQGASEADLPHKRLTGSTPALRPFLCSPSNSTVELRPRSLCEAFDSLLGLHTVLLTGCRESRRLKHFRGAKARSRFCLSVERLRKRTPPISTHGRPESS
jgi:hypothetical protein